MTLAPYFDAILGAARSGAAWAWQEIFREFAGPIAGYARTRGVAEPEEVLQETLLAAARDIHRFAGGEEEFRAWIFTIAHRRVVDSFRTAGREPPRTDTDVSDLDVHDKWLGDVEREAMSNMSLIEVSVLVRGLTAAQRDVLLLRVVADLSVTETAKILDKSESAVKVLQFRALKTLREKLRGHE